MIVCVQVLGRGTHQSCLVMQTDRVRECTGRSVKRPAPSTASGNGIPGNLLNVFYSVPIALKKIFFFSSSIRLGIFLRRYPMARVFVIIYMVSSQCVKECLEVKIKKSNLWEKCNVLCVYRVYLFICLLNVCFSLQALLHLWVMIVLLTYTPEMHPSHPDGR